MSLPTPPAGLVDPNAETGRVIGQRQWVKPQVTIIKAGSAEAISRNGQPDGGGPGTSRS